MSAADRDDLLPPPLGDCPICGEPLDEDTNVVWSDTAHGWVHESCDANRPTPQKQTEKEAD